MDYWRQEDAMWWVPASGNCIPPGAVEGGRDLDGGVLYVGRAHYEGDQLPAKVVPNHRCAYVSYAGREIPVQEFEILKSHHIGWTHTNGNFIPPEAIKAGCTRDGEPLFVGRALVEGTVTVGKVHPSQGVLYVAWNGEERAFREFEILVLRPPM